MTSKNNSSNGSAPEGKPIVQELSSHEMAAQAVPTEIRLAHSREVLTVSFQSGDVFELSAEYLRVFSPSAEVQGHSAAERKLQFGKKMVLITEIEPVGNYAIKIMFSDGHKTGIYSWVYLYRLGAEHGELWPEYLAELEEAGKSR